MYPQIASLGLLGKPVFPYRTIYSSIDSLALGAGMPIVPVALTNLDAQINDEIMEAGRYYQKLLNVLDFFHKGMSIVAGVMLMILCHKRTAPRFYSFCIISNSTRCFVPLNGHISKL